MAIQPIALPGGYGARDDFQGEKFISPLESLQMFQGQQTMGQNQRKMDLLNADEMRKQQARDTLASRLSQPVQVSDLEKSQIMSEVQAFKAKNPQIQIPEEQIYNDFMKRRMQQKQNLQQDKLMKSQVDVGGYLAESGVEDNGLSKSSEISNLRATHNTYLNLARALIDRGAQEGDPQLEKAKKTINATASRLRELGMPIEGFGGVDDKVYYTSTTKSNVMKDARSEAKKLINTAVDKTGLRGKPDGVIDNIDEIEQGLDEIAFNYGLNTKSDDWNRLVDLLEKKKTMMSGIISAGERQEKTEFERAMKQKTVSQGASSINAERAKKNVIDLRRDPENISSRTGGLNTLLRAESGAAIGKDEVISRIQNVVPDEIARQILSDQSGIKRWIADKTISDEQFTAMMIKDYIGQIDTESLINQLRIRAGESAESVSKNEKVIQPKPSKEGRTVVSEEDFFGS